MPCNSVAVQSGRIAAGLYGFLRDQPLVQQTIAGWLKQELRLTGNVQVKVSGRSIQIFLGDGQSRIVMLEDGTLNTYAPYPLNQALGKLIAKAGTNPSQLELMLGRIVQDLLARMSFEALKQMGAKGFETAFNERGDFVVRARVEI